MLIAALAMTSAGVVSAVMRSAGTSKSPGPLLAMYSVVFGITLVASHHLSSMSAFPLVLIGSPLFILAVALLVARDADMRVRPVTGLEYVSMALVGLAAAMIYDLVYMAPALAAVFIVVRAVVAGHGSRQVLRIAAVRRWAVLTAGFLAVFVPARVAIAVQCSRQYCNPASEIVVSVDVVGLIAQRVLTGSPPAGWAHAADRVAPYGYRVGLADLVSNWLVAALIVVAAVLCVRAVRPLLSRGGVDGDEPAVLGPLAVGLGVLGALTVLMPALMVSLSKEIQGAPPALGESWRDSLVVQIGWSFMIFAVVVAALALARGSGPRRAVAVVVAAALFIGLAVTLINNERLSHVGRGTQTTMLVRQMHSSVVRVDLTEGGNARRCGLIDAYGDLYPDRKGWWRGPQLREELNHFMLDRYDVLFCDGPGTETELTSEPPEAWDWRAWEWDRKP